MYVKSPKGGTHIRRISFDCLRNQEVVGSQCETVGSQVIFWRPQDEKVEKDVEMWSNKWVFPFSPPSPKASPWHWELGELRLREVTLLFMRFLSCILSSSRSSLLVCGATYKGWSKLTDSVNSASACLLHRSLLITVSNCLTDTTQGRNCLCASQFQIVEHVLHALRHNVMLVGGWGRGLLIHCSRSGAKSKTGRCHE